MPTITTPMRILDTASFVLEPQTAAHAEEMFVVLCDPRIYEYENAPPTSLAWLQARFTRLESRCSADGREQWLNWVIRVPDQRLIGFVQATVHGNGSAGIAYELSSTDWGRGLAQQAVALMIGELNEHYRVDHFHAVLKSANRRSVRLLERLGFALAPEALRAALEIDADEIIMQREMPSTSPRDAAGALHFSTLGEVAT